MNFLTGGSTPEKKDNPEEKKDILKTYLSKPKDVGLRINVKDSPRFFQLGDWSSGDNVVDSKIDKIVAHIKKQKFDFGVLTGDNYENKVKTSLDASEIVIKHDYAKLNSLGIPLLSIFGDADIESCDIMKAEMDLTSVIISQQNMKLDTSKSNWIIPYSYYTVDCLNNRFFMLDTNLISPTTTMNTCYQQYNYNPLDEMLKWFGEKSKEKLSSKAFIVTHKPLISIKDDAYYVIITKDLLLKMAESGRKHFYNLCSGVHNFQSLLFESSSTFGNFTIEIIVSGTGGACPAPKNLKVAKIMNIPQDIILTDNTNIGKLTVKKIADPYGYTCYEFDSLGNLVIKYHNLS